MNVPNQFVLSILFSYLYEILFWLKILFLLVIIKLEILIGKLMRLIVNSVQWCAFNERNTIIPNDTFCTGCMKSHFCLITVHSVLMYWKLFQYMEFNQFNWNNFVTLKSYALFFHRRQYKLTLDRHSSADQAASLHIPVWSCLTQLITMRKRKERRRW